uniref:Homeobox domain-containing protein n=1 Tax=Timema poppense TaxID=170557 RepID=A0A7R9GYH4_TIMPO|nr:unnamed protein product [Timema poppensis]
MSPPRKNIPENHSLDSSLDKLPDTSQPDSTRVTPWAAYSAVQATSTANRLLTRNFDALSSIVTNELHTFLADIKSFPFYSRTSPANTHSHTHTHTHTDAGKELSWASYDERVNNRTISAPSSREMSHGEVLDRDVTGRVMDSSESGSHKGRESGRSGGSNKTSGDGKPTRVRTVLNEKQLHTLRTCYNANPRPDALMKEQLVEMTQLSPRVIRVWFQNKRCKDKKKAILMKQQMQQEKTLTVNPPDSVELEPLNGGQIASSVAPVLSP